MSNEINEETSFPSPPVATDWFRWMEVTSACRSLLEMFRNEASLGLMRGHLREYVTNASSVPEHLRSACDEQFSICEDLVFKVSKELSLSTDQTMSDEPNARFSTM